MKINLTYILDRCERMNLEEYDNWIPEDCNIQVAKNIQSGEEPPETTAFKQYMPKIFEDFNWDILLLNINRYDCQNSYHKTKKCSFKLKNIIMIIKKH